MPGRALADSPGEQRCARSGGSSGTRQPPCPASLPASSSALPASLPASCPAPSRAHTCLAKVSARAALGARPGRARLGNPARASAPALWVPASAGNPGCEHCTCQRGIRGSFGPECLSRARGQRVVVTFSVDFVLLASSHLIWFRGFKSGQKRKRNRLVDALGVTVATRNHQTGYLKSI